MTQATWQNSAMTELAFKVFFKVQGQEYEVQLSTLVNESLTEEAATTQ